MAKTAKEINALDVIRKRLKVGCRIQLIHHWREDVEGEFRESRPDFFDVRSVKTAHKTEIMFTNDAYLTFPDPSRVSLTANGFRISMAEPGDVSPRFLEYEWR